VLGELRWSYARPGCSAARPRAPPAPPAPPEASVRPYEEDHGMDTPNWELDADTLSKPACWDLMDKMSLMEPASEYVDDWLRELTQGPNARKHVSSSRRGIYRNHPADDNFEDVLYRLRGGFKR
jgi:hypothetical protein